MDLKVNDKGIIELREVFGGITLITSDGEKLSIAMRDSGFEFNYYGKHYFAKEGYVESFNESVRGNFLVNQTHQEDSVACDNGELKQD